MEKIVWRDDFDRPTGLSIVTHATDVVETRIREGLTLIIKHIESVHGRGFKCKVDRGVGLSVVTGDVHLGTDDDAYHAAVEEGQEIMRRLIAEDIAEMRRVDDLQKLRDEGK